MNLLYFCLFQSVVCTDLIPDQFIVAFKDSVRNVSLAAQEFLAQGSGSSPREEIISVMDYEGFKAITIKALPSFSNPKPEDFLRENVAFVEQDAIFHVNTLQPGLPTQRGEVSPAFGAGSWGLRRIISRQLFDIKFEYYSYPTSAGEGVRVYVIDGGVDVNHPEFESRARVGKAYNPRGEKDKNGHGTHIAGIIASRTYGVAKKATIISVNTMNRFGFITSAAIVGGLHWAIEDAKSNPGIKNVINISMGNSFWPPFLMRAVKRARKNGIAVVVAAGNDNRDSCKDYPGASPFAVTVGASNIKDRIADFSNTGRCVDIFAPGEHVESIGGIRSGTSMAAPFVSGALALQMAEIDYETVDAAIDDLLVYGINGALSVGTTEKTGIRSKFQQKRRNQLFTQTSNLLLHTRWLLD